MKLKFTDFGRVIHFPWGPSRSYTAKSDIAALGIPTGAVLDRTIDDDILYAIDYQTISPHFDNIWVANSVDGKQTVGGNFGDGNGERDLPAEMTFWALHGASTEWWRSDLINLQHKLQDQTLSLNAFAYEDFSP